MFSKVDTLALYMAWFLPAPGPQEWQDQALALPAPATARIDAYLADRENVTALPAVPGGAGCSPPPAPGRRGRTGPRSTPFCAVSAEPPASSPVQAAATLSSSRIIQRDCLVSSIRRGSTPAFGTGSGENGVAARRTRADENKTIPVDDYEHTAAKRTNNPPAGLAHLDRDETPTRRIKYEFDPHLDPVLTWAGKAERQVVQVPAPSIHVHEELSAQKIIGSVRKQTTSAAPV